MAAASRPSPNVRTMKCKVHAVEGAPGAPLSLAYGCDGSSARSVHSGRAKPATSTLATASNRAPQPLLRSSLTPPRAISAADHAEFAAPVCPS